jgi:hypothetical protein
MGEEYLGMGRNEVGEVLKVSGWGPVVRRS